MNHIEREDRFVIIRREADGKHRFISIGHGWTTNREMLKTFDTANEARICLNNRVGEIVRLRDLRTADGPRPQRPATEEAKP
jgi:hypothetical protein